MNPKDLVGAKKAPLEGVPVAGAIFAAPAHAIGHAKYGPFNWRDQPVQVMSYIGAIQRHLAAYVDGQDYAEDTKVHHLAHALAGLNIIADSMGLGTLIDNRPLPGPAAHMLRDQDQSLAPQANEDVTVLEGITAMLAIPAALEATPPTWEAINGPDGTYSWPDPRFRYTDGPSGFLEDADGPA